MDLAKAEITDRPRLLESNILELEITEVEGAISDRQLGVSVPLAAGWLGDVQAPAARWRHLLASSLLSGRAAGHSRGAGRDRPRRLVSDGRHLYRAPSSAQAVRSRSSTDQGRAADLHHRGRRRAPNEIEADGSGIVKRMLCENGQAVEFGQPLFIIE